MVNASAHRRPPKWLLILLYPYVAVTGAMAWVLAMVVSIPATILVNTVFRGHCYHCGRRGLRGARCGGDDTVHPGDSRPFHFSQCDYCKYQFHTFDNHSRIDIPPDDPRYVTV